MSQSYQIDQLKLVADVSQALAKQHPGIPADCRMNAVIHACSLICSAYGQTDEEFKKSTEHSV